MKKAIVFALVALMLTGLFCGCRPTRFQLTVEGGRDLLYESPEGRYDPDTEIVIKTHIVYDADVECFVNGKSIGTQTTIMTDGEYTHWEFYFTMPAEDVVVTLKTVGEKE